nr:MAG TPA: hypothetical protein [Caudoviricetes sp.]DAU94206.1 MAG TPA: hypothetical protein [Caudoviricetes sp.]
METYSLLLEGLYPYRVFVMEFLASPSLSPTNFLATL